MTTIEDFCNAKWITPEWLASEKGDLTLNDSDPCLPDDQLIVGGNMWISKRDFSGFPPIVRINGKLEISNIPEVVFPMDMVVKGSVTIKNVTKVTITKGCRFENLRIESCKDLTLPDYWTVAHDLQIMECPISNLPLRLTAGHMLNLYRTQVSEIRPDCKARTWHIHECPLHTLPDNWIVEEDLDVRACPIEQLPKQLTVGRTLFLTDTNITELPNDCSMLNLDASYSKLRELPKAFSLEGFLDLTHCEEISLPDDLCVKDLFLGRCVIQSFPKRMTVRDTLSLDHSQVCVIPDDCQVGSLVAPHARLAGLPDNWTLSGSLILSQAKLAVFPKGLTVQQRLLIDYTDIKELPEDCHVGALYAEHSQLAHLPNKWHVPGCVVLDSCPIGALPKVLTVGGVLDISRTYIRVVHKKCQVGGLTAADSRLRKLPDNWSVPGNLVLQNCKRLTELPQRLSVGQTLDIAESAVTCIPDNCVVTNLNAMDSDLESLPDNWSVPGYVILDRCQHFQALPQGLRVGKLLSIASTAVSVVPTDCRFHSLFAANSQLSQVSSVTDVPGSLNINGCPVRELPHLRTVGEDLHASRSALVGLPSGLRIGGNLDIEHTPIKELPEDLVVGGVLSMDNI